MSEINVVTLEGITQDLGTSTFDPTKGCDGGLDHVCGSGCEPALKQVQADTKVEEAAPLDSSKRIWKFKKKRVQTRKSISLRGESFKLIYAYCADKKISMSEWLEGQITKFFENPPVDAPAHEVVDKAESSSTLPVKPKKKKVNQFNNPGFSKRDNHNRQFGCTNEVHILGCPKYKQGSVTRPNDLGLVTEPSEVVAPVVAKPKRSRPAFVSQSITNEDRKASTNGPIRAKAAADAANPAKSIDPEVLQHIRDKVKSVVVVQQGRPAPTKLVTDANRTSVVATADGKLFDRGAF